MSTNLPNKLLKQRYPPLTPRRRVSFYLGHCTYTTFTHLLTKCGLNEKTGNKNHTYLCPASTNWSPNSRDEVHLTDHLIQEMKCMHQLLCNSEYSSFLTCGSLWWKLSLAPPCNACPPWAPRTSFSGSSLSHPLLPRRHLCCFFLSSTNSKCGRAPGLSPQPSALPLLTPWMSSRQPQSFPC